MSQAGYFLLQVTEFVLVYPALFRFYLQLVRAPARNPLTTFVIAMTDFAVRPLRKFVPGFQGMDLASLLWALLAEIVLLILFFALAGNNIFTGGPVTVPALLFLALMRLVRFTLYLLIFVVFVQAIMSWFSPYHPMRSVFDSLTRPFLKPLQRVVPTVGGVDLTPLIVFVVCQLILILPVDTLETAALRMLATAGR